MLNIVLDKLFFPISKISFSEQPVWDNHKQDRSNTQINFITVACRLYYNLLYHDLCIPLAKLTDTVMLKQASFASV